MKRLISPEAVQCRNEANLGLQNLKQAGVICAGKAEIEITSEGEEIVSQEVLPAFTLKKLYGVFTVNGIY